MNYNPSLPFYEHSLTSSKALAVSTSDGDITYGEMSIRAQKISHWLTHSLGRNPKRIGILATRSIEACAAVLAVNWGGGCYVPISLKLPEERLCSVLTLGGLDALITDTEGALLLTEAVRSACPPYILTPDMALPEDGYHHSPVPMQATDTAYIIFTSGTTGIPKGVMVSASALRHFASTMQQLYYFSPEDRIAETADISFDLSVGNMYMTWEAGASLHVVPSTQALSPSKFIQNRQLTVWFSVPSIIALMQRMGTLKPSIFPTLRYSLFIGEPLPLNSALAWHKAAPQSQLENLYGPTEATVACTRYPLPDTLAASGHDTVAIGKAFPGTNMAIMGSDLSFLPLGTKGELALFGPQLADGYFNDPKMTNARFPIIEGKRWYLTGDLAICDESGVYHHCGRVDNQVKVMGYRVELEDIEAHLRNACGSELVAAVAWPVSHGSASGIIGFVSGTNSNPSDIRQLLKEKLPNYMVPTAIHVLEILPLTANGKVDRKRLLAQLEGNAANG